jgi:penicillin-binding protein
MTKKKSRRRRKRTGKVLRLIAGIMGAITFGMAVYMLILAKTGSNLTRPDELLLTYMNYISEQNYKEMYQMLDVDASRQISEEDFIKRNSAISESGGWKRKYCQRVLSI